MSLIQEALEKAGRVSAGMPNPAPPEKKRPVLLEKKSVPIQPEIKEVFVEKIAAVSPEPFWLVGLKIKFLGAMDKIDIRPGFIAAALITIFLGAVLYVHSFALKTPVVDTPFQSADQSDDALPPSSGMVPPDFQLTGITLSGNTPLALINDQVVGVGEKLKENATVLEIQQQKAVIEFQGKRIELEL